MQPRKPDTLALLVALIGSFLVLIAFLVDLMLSRQRDLEDGQQRLQHFSTMVAEHTSRSFEAVDIVLRDMVSDLTGNHPDWQEWNASHGWEYVSQRHSRSLPQLRELILFDAQGNQRFISTFFPAPRVSVRDRPYFSELEKGAEAVSYGPYVGRNSDRYAYALARRIQDGLSRFAGIAYAAIEPGYFPDFCWSNRLSDDFEAVLINAKGQIAASCRPVDLTGHASFIGSFAEDSLMGGKLRGQLPEAGMRSVNGLLVAITPVPNYADLRILTVIPESAILAPWTRRATEFSLFALLVVVVLLAGGWLVRRQIRELSQVTTALEEHRRHLEERVREATAELAYKKEEAERSSTAKSRFLAAASHDLRQPLHALSLFAADLQRQVKTGNTAGLPRLSEQITTSTGVLGELLDSLLDVSRLDVAGIKTDVRAFPIQDVFDRLAASYKRSAQAKHMVLRFRPTAAHVMSDPTLVERLLANLISNAIRYTPDGGRVLVAARRQGDHLRIEVRDSGIGIAPEHQAAIFAEFYQVGNTAREQNKGLGLGLSIVDRLAYALGAPIYLRSRPGVGTTFAVALPRCVPDPAQAQVTAPAVEPSCVLMVGVSEAIGTAAKLVQGWGLKVRQVPDLAGIDPGENWQPTVAITDVEYTAELQELLPPACPLVAIAADASTAPAGAYALATPIRPAKLRALLEQLQKTESKSTP